MDESTYLSDQIERIREDIEAFDDGDTNCFEMAAAIVKRCESILAVKELIITNK